MFMSTSPCHLWHSWGFEMPPASFLTPGIFISDMDVAPQMKTILESEIEGCQNLQLFQAEFLSIFQ